MKINNVEVPSLIILCGILLSSWYELKHSVPQWWWFLLPEKGIVRVDHIGPVEWWRSLLLAVLGDGLGKHRQHVAHLLHGVLELYLG